VLVEYSGSTLSTGRTLASYAFCLDKMKMSRNSPTNPNTRGVIGLVCGVLVCVFFTSQLRSAADTIRRSKYAISSLIDIRLVQSTSFDTTMLLSDPKATFSRLCCTVREQETASVASSPLLSQSLSELSHGDNGLLAEFDAHERLSFDTPVLVKATPAIPTSAYTLANFADEIIEMEERTQPTEWKDPSTLPSLSALSVCSDSTTENELYETTPKSNLRPLKSSLRSSQYKKKGRCSIRGSLEVRGLWNEDTSNPFSKVHNDALLSILSYCTVPETCRLSMVSSRWNFVANQDRVWKSVDATEMIQTLYKYNSKANPTTAAEETSVALASRLDKHALEKLTLRSIGSSLLADKFHITTNGLQELTLTGFSDLTDTHVHVMLLGVADGQARTKTNNNLRKVVLDECPRLTNAVIRSIALRCPNLEELSLRGCCNISNLTPLKNRWKHRLVDSPPPVQSAVISSSLGSLFAPPTPPQPSLSSLFAPPAPSKPSLSSLFAPPAPPQPSLSSLFAPPTTPDSGAGALASLFEPPGTRPNRFTALNFSLPTSLTRASSSNVAKLCRLDVSYTAVTASSLLEALGYGATDRKVELESLWMQGSGESQWRHDHLTKFSEIVDVGVMQTLDIDCADVKEGESCLTTSGLSALLRGTGGATSPRSRQASIQDQEAVSRLQSHSAIPSSRQRRGLQHHLSPLFNF
jgi:hypothetical protein